MTVSSATFVSTEATESFEPGHTKHQSHQESAAAHAAMQSPNLPPLVRTSTGWTPQAPSTLADAGLDPWVINDLDLKLIGTVPHLTTEWAADQLRLPMDLVEKIFWQLKEDQLVEILGQTGEFGYRYAATGRGREQAK